MSGVAEKKLPILAGVVGWPVKHSLSPLIYAIWAHRAGIDGYYIPLAVRPDYDDFARAMDSLRKIGFSGVNVTVPHKEHALRYADKASVTAKSAGAANMLTFQEEKTYADNSDVEGFACAIIEQEQIAAQSKTVLLLGAGGAARGVLLALKKLGCEDILIANRTREKAEALADLFSVSAIDWAERKEALQSADLLVNATSLGMTNQPPLELSLKNIRSGALVADIVYSPLQTKLLKEAAAKGLKTIDGLSMLMHQAAPGFRTWFGGPAQVDAALRAALVRERERRTA